MTKLFFPILSLLLSVSILLIGHGVQLTIVPLYGSSLGWSNSDIGLTGSAYFAGFVLGCLTVPILVARAGHIRMFGVLTSAATAALLTIPLLPFLPAWLVARLVTGWCIAGLYMVIESWLNERTTSGNRGLVLSVYTILTLSSIGIGQLMIGIPLEYLQFFMIGAGLIALGSIPVGLTRSPAPAPLTTVSFEFGKVWNASHTAVICALVGGLTTSSFWSLAPVVAREQGLAGREIGLFLALTIIGGALLQLPVGRLSDYIDRRYVMGGLAVAGTMVSVLVLLYGEVNSMFLLGAMFFYGGTTFPLYSLSLAHANDQSNIPLIQIGSVILLTHSAGSIVGPIVTSTLMNIFPAAMFATSAAVMFCFAAWVLWRATSHAASRKYFEPFPDLPRTTIEALDSYESVVEPAQDADRQAT